MAYCRTFFLAFVLMLVGCTATQTQVLFDYQAPALGSSETVKRDDLNAELAGINGAKIDFTDIDTSAELRAVITDEVGTGPLMFGLAPSMADDLSCTGNQAVRRNAGDTAWECATIGGLSTADIDTSAELRAIVTDETGSGALVFATSPVLVTPNLGTPSALTLTNATGLPIGGLTGLGTGVGTWLATPSSGNLATAVTDETGSGALVFATSPVLVTPNLGTPSALTLTNATGLPIGGLTGLGTNVGTWLATPSSANLRSALTDEVGSGVLVFLGTPADDQVPVGDSATATTWRTLPNVAAGSYLTYSTTTNLFGTATDDDVPEQADLTALGATAPLTQSGGTVSTSIATGRLVGRTTAGTGVMEQITPDATLSLSGLSLSVVDVNCTGCLGSSEIASLDASDITGGTFADAQINGANEADEVNPILGTQTQGNYIIDIAAGIGIAVTHTPGEGSTPAVEFDFTDAGVSPNIAADKCRFTSDASVPGFLVCEGNIADAFETRIAITDPTADRVMTIPDADSNPVQPFTCPSTDKVSAISATGVLTCTSDAGAAGGGLAPADIDTSAELRAIVSDEVGTGPLMFGLTAGMADDFVSCTGSQVVRRNAGDTAWECATVSSSVEDNIRVETSSGTFTAAVDADFADTGDIDFGMTGSGPSVISATVKPDSVALNTDTTGPYLSGINEQANGIDLSTSASGDALTLSVAPDFTELTSATLGTDNFTTTTFSTDGVDLTWDYTTTNGAAVLSGGGSSPILGLDDQGALRFFEEDAGGSNFIAFVPPSTIAADRTCSLVDGTAMIPDTCVGNGADDGLLSTAIDTSSEIAGIVGDETGSGALVFASSPVLVTPNLGTPSALTLTNATGLPIGGLTGLGTGVGTWLATPSSTNLASAVTDETGSGVLVFATSPVLVTPNLGTPSALTLTNATGLPIGGLTGLGTGVGTWLATPSSANLRSALTDEVGTGAAMFGMDEAMADDFASCTGSQVVRRNAGDTAWECVTISAGGLAASDIDTSAKLAAIVTDETGSGDLVFGTAPDITISATTESNIESAIDTLGTVAVTDLTCSNCLGSGDIAGLDAGDTTTGTFADARIDGSLESDEVKPLESLCMALSDETTSITTGTAKLTMRMPYAFTLKASTSASDNGVRASVNGASSSGVVTVDINENGTSIMTTNKLSIDASEETSTTAATAAALTDTSLADDAEMTFDVDAAGTSVEGLKVCLIGNRT